MWHALPYKHLQVKILNQSSAAFFPLVGTWSPFRFGHCDPAHPTGSTGGHFGSAQLPHIGPGSFTLIP